MKTFFLMFFLASSIVLADDRSDMDTASREYVMELTTTGKVLNVRHEMPAPGSMGIPEGNTFVDVEITLNNCGDILGPVSYTYDVIQDKNGNVKKATIYLNAINFTDKTPGSIACAKIETRQVSLHIGSYGFSGFSGPAAVEKTELRFLNLTPDQ